MKPLLLFLLSIMLLAGCQETKECEEEIYLVPEGFRGKVIVFFDQPDGQEMEYENYARVYHIPESGYIKSQFPKNGGCMGDGRIRFFYEDSLGGRQNLDYFLNIDRDSLPTDRDYVLFTFLSDKTTKPDFVIHFVGHLKEFNELMGSAKNLQPEKILESL